MKESYLKMLRYIGLLNFFEVALGILIFVYLPKKKEYEIIGDELINYNKAILGFSISLFIITFVFVIFNICFCLLGNSYDEGTVCFCHILIIMYLKLILTFTEWSISLASITLINKENKQDRNKNNPAFSNFREKTVKVVIIITANLLLNIIEIILASCVYQYQCFEGFNIYPATPPNIRVGINTATIVARSGNDVVVGHIETVQVQNI